MRGMISIFVTAGLAAACGGSNTRCQVGDTLCDENVAVRCEDESGGGDADGEFVPIRDCGAEGLICAEEAIELGISFVGCVPEGCEGGCVDTSAPSACSRDRTNVTTCVTSTDGCPRRSVVQGCADTGEVCEYLPTSGAACQAP